MDKERISYAADSECFMQILKINPITHLTH